VNFSDDAEIAGIVKKWTTPYAATDEMHDEAPGTSDSDRRQSVGARHRGWPYLPLRRQIFQADERQGAGPDGKEHFVSMGSYGIGPTRLIAAIIEASHDEAGIIWPKRRALRRRVDQYEGWRRGMRPRLRELYAALLTAAGKTCSTTTPISAPAASSRRPT
jgi:hypothetical protein